MARTSTTAEVEQALGVAERTLRRWRKRGLGADPAPRGRALLWDVAEVRAFRDAHGLGTVGGPGDERGPRVAPPGSPLRPVVAPATPTAPSSGAPAAPPPGPPQPTELQAARTRKVELETQAAELKLAHARGELVPLADVRTFWSTQVARVKTAFQQLPGALAPRLCDLELEAIHAVLERELDQVLEAFAAGQLPGQPELPPTRLEAQPHGGALLRYEQKDGAT